MDKPENIPDIVYKYRNWKCQHHKDVLLKNHLYLSSPKDFNDPFDCRIPINYNLLDSPEKIESFINNKIESCYSLYDEEKIKSKKLEIKERLKNIELFQKEHENNLYEFQDKYYGILSLNTKWNNILMWSHYADFHKGYCVGFWEDKLRNSGIGISGLVTTRDDYPQIDPLDNDVIRQALIQTQTKAKDWEYEKEYRLTKIFDFFIGKEPTKEERIEKIPDEFFAEIIIGIDTPLNDRDKIIEIGKQKGIKVFETFKVPFQFQIDRKEIKLNSL